jgi:uncharacterized membrane protein YccC
MSREASGILGPRRADWVDLRRLAGAVEAAGPALFFGVRLWISVCLALYIAFRLELDNPFWAATSAAIVCQPSLGASLRKGSARLIGTVIGAVAVVVLTAAVPQDRIAYLLALALWGAACSFLATVLRNSTSYAASLAGYTAAIIAADLLGPTGGANGDVFMLALSRATEISIGIFSAGIVLAATDFGTARRRLAGQITAVAAEITGQLAATFAPEGPDHAAARRVRHALIGRVVALGPVIDEAIGESSDLRHRVRTLRAAMDGLFAALSGWRTASNSLELLPDVQRRREAAAVLGSLPPALRAAPTQGDPAAWASVSSDLHRISRAAARSLVALPASTPSLRLMADATAEALLGLTQAFNGLTLLLDPGRAVETRHAGRLHVPDLLPAAINGLRVFAAIAVVALFWIVTAWPNGGLAMTFAAIGTILMSPLGDRAYLGAKAFLFGIVMTAVLAGIIDFAVLPRARTFVELSLAIGLALVPLGALSTRTAIGPMFTAGVIVLIPLLGPTNQMVYSTVQFYNTTLAIMTGMAATMLAIVLIPPAPPAMRARRLLALTLRDLRRLAAGAAAPDISDWEGLLYSRLSAMPPQAGPLQLAWLAAALSVGTEIIRLRRLARRLDPGTDLEAAFEALAVGNGAVALERLDFVDRQLAAVPVSRDPEALALRARGSIRALSEAVIRHADYFAPEAAR